MADFAFRVKPEELEKKSGEFTAIVNSIKGHFARIEEISGKTRGYWRGEAGDKDRSGYASYQDDINFIVKRLNEHPRDLLRMAGIYKSAEQEVKEDVTKLKVDQII